MKMNYTITNQARFSNNKGLELQNCIMVLRSSSLQSRFKQGTKHFEDCTFLAETKEGNKRCVKLSKLANPRGTT